LRELPVNGVYQAIVLAVGHKEFIEMGSSKIQMLTQNHGVIFDVKGVLPIEAVDGRL
jgi:UDP-N-acetyl-D-galactosamine dehydrogenase